MQKGIKTRLIIHQMLLKLKNNIGNFDTIFESELNKNE